LREVMGERPGLHTLFLRYVRVFMLQTTYTAVACGRSEAVERLARWLLMTHDRLDGDDLPLVHEFLSLMLGVRRESVTLALHRLEGAGAIVASRGNIKVRDRQILKDCAGPIYGVPEAEYERLLGSPTVAECSA
jgi:CRP-like cAMP-binding protein